MKKPCVLLAILLLFTLTAGCKEKSADPTKPATDPTKATGSANPAETTGTSQPDNPANPEPVVNVQDSANIVKLEEDKITWSPAKYISASTDYRKSHTPFVSKMENGVLTDGVTEIAFAADCRYDIVNAKISNVSLLEGVDSNEYSNLITNHKAKVEFNGRNVTVNIGWWHESNNYYKSFTELAYIICVEDKSGDLHNYYFEVKYSTTDPVGLLVEEDYEWFIKHQWRYSQAHSCTFAKPEDISAEYYFYGGLYNYYEPDTEEEIAYFNGNRPHIKMPVDKMNEALSILGVTVGDLQIPEYWKYFEETDAYYFNRKDAFGVGKWSVTKVEKEEDGIVKVYWETNERHFNTYANEYFPKDTTVKMVYTMQLQKDGTYRVLSNLPQE